MPQIRCTAFGLTPALIAVRRRCCRRRWAEPL